MTDAQDFHDAVGMLDNFVGSNRELQAYADWLQVRAEQYFDRDDWWEAIKAVAKALMEREKLSANEVKEIVSCAFDAMIARRIKKT